MEKFRNHPTRPASVSWDGMIDYYSGYVIPDGQLHRYARLIAANFDCRDRPTEPYPFLIRGRLLSMRGEFDKAAADFATAWKLNGRGWVIAECRSLLIEPEIVMFAQPDIQKDYHTLQLAATYLEQDPKTMAPLLLGIPPAHRVSLANAKLQLGLPLDEQDRTTLAGLIRLPGW